jgi:hypothetical protein
LVPGKVIQILHSYKLIRVERIRNERRNSFDGKHTPIILRENERGGIR